jgi:hypothetical protein
VILSENFPCLSRRRASWRFGYPSDGVWPAMAKGGSAGPPHLPPSATMHQTNTLDEATARSVDRLAGVGLSRLTLTSELWRPFGILSLTGSGNGVTSTGDRS